MVPILARSSAHAVAATAGLKAGLSKKSGWVSEIVVSILIGMPMSIVGIDPRSHYIIRRR